MTNRTLYHPTIPGITRTAPADDVASWKAAGWRLTPPRDKGPDTSEDDTASATNEGVE